jgi:ketosteroid isomerase-like protein
VSEADIVARNIEIVKVMLESGHAGRWDVMKPHVADDVILRVPAGLPFGRDYHGWEGYMDALKTIGGFFKEIKAGPREFAAVGDKVIVMAMLSCRIASNGKAISFPLMDVWELRDGKVILITAFYYDTKAIFDQAQ